MARPALVSADPRRPVISMAIHERQWFPRVVSDHYSFRPKGWLAWLQRACWAILQRTGGLRRAVIEDSYFKVVHLDTEGVARRIIEAHYGLQRAYGEPPTRVLIGPGELAELMRSTEYRDLHHSRGVKFEVQRFVGMTVEVVPHMKGVLVL